MRRRPDPHLAAFRRERRANPHLETDELWRRAGLKLGRDHPLWAQHGQALRPVICKKPPVG